MRGYFYFAFNFIILAICNELNAKEIHQHGYWSGDDVGSEHCFDLLLAETLVDFFKQENASSLIDFGCGLGDYVKAFINAGFNCEGYDGNPDTYRITNGVAQVLDLSQPFDLYKKFDWILSLEVGEHLPKCYEECFIENLNKHNVSGIVLSWAIVGQGGFGHYNCQDNDYIKNIFLNLGYYNDVDAEQILRKKSSLSWFKNTIMVFRKK